MQVIHMKGVDNIYSDAASRSPPECGDSRCQVCKYISELADSVVRSCSASDVLDARIAVPYSSKAGWYELQHDCESLRRACAHLKQGTTPSKKATNIKDGKMVSARLVTIINCAINSLEQSSYDTTSVVTPYKRKRSCLQSPILDARLHATPALLPS